MKEKKDWYAPLSMPKAWTGGNFTLTGVCEFGGAMYVCGKDGVLGKSSDGVNWTDIATGTKVDFWQIVPGTDCMWIAATDGLWRYRPGLKLDHVKDGVDIKDIYVHGNLVFCGGYNGGLFVDNGESFRCLMDARRAPAVRSLCVIRNIVLAGSKGGQISQWDISRGLILGELNGVPGNGVIVSNGSDAVYAHRAIEYNGNPVYTVPPNDEGKTANISCAKWVGDRVYFLGEDGMHLTLDLVSVKVKENNLYSKGLFLACEMFQGKLVGVGSGIRDDSGVISPIVLIDIDDNPPPPPPPPPPPGQENVKKQLKDIADALCGKLVALNHVIDGM